MTDYTRYLVDTDEISYHIAIWCQDCTDPQSGQGDQDDLMIWQNTDEQVTALCVANFIAIADEHEQQHHAAVDVSLRVGAEVCAAMNTMHCGDGSWTVISLGEGA